MFSVLMSVYKNDVAEYVRAAIESIENQTRLPKQFVLVCDGPLKKELWEEIEKRKISFERKKIEFLCVPLKENGGLGEALNIGSRRCSEEYIIRMDSDDYSLPNRFQSLWQHVMSNPEIDVWGAQIEEFQFKYGDLKRYRKMPEGHKAIHRTRLFRSPMNHVTVCIRKSALTDAGGYEDVLFFEDYFLWLKLFKKQYRFANIPEVHVNVRVDGLTMRRHGINYFLREVKFATLVTHRKILPVWWMIFFICSRIFVRLSPKSFTGFVYSISRRF